MMAEYRVRVGKFRVYIKVLNLDFKTRKEGRISNYHAFHKILEKGVVTEEFGANLQIRNITREEIEDVVREVAISKLCSMLGIGPAFDVTIPFDVVIYANAVQFHLENCGQYCLYILK
jgi:SpoVK/Ycf46/Vps4 family AAA+-type ATPase